MDELIKGVLPVGARLAPIDGTRIIGDGFPIERHVLAVALHRQLLQIGGKSLQVLLVGKDRDGLSIEEIYIPDGEQAHEHGKVLSKRRLAEVLVHLMTAVEHGQEIVWSNRNHRRKADG